MIADMLSNKNFKQTKHFSCFCYTILNVVPKSVRLNSTYYFIMKIANKQECKQIAINHSSEIDFNFMNLYTNCTAKPYFFLFNDITLASGNS